MNLEFFVSRRKLTRKGTTSAVVDGSGTDTFTIEFDQEWDGLAKLVELKNGDACAQVFYMGKTPLPCQVCGRGALYLTCYGYRKKGDAVAVIRTAPMVHPVLMAGPSEVEGSNSQPYTPSAFDQMAAMVAQAKLAANEAGSVAARLMQMKETGAFTGPAGPAATVRVLSVQNGTPACVENLGSPNNALLRFTLPYAMTEEEKQAMEAAIRETLVGNIGQALDEILVIQNACIARGTAADEEEEV